MPSFAGNSAARCSARVLEPMKIALALLSCLWSVVSLTQDLIVVAKIDELPSDRYQLLKEPGCNEPTASGEFVVCTGAWQRYRLTNVVTLDSAHLPDTVALIYTDPHLGGAKLLTLEALSHRDSVVFGASYKVKSVGRAFSVVCSDKAFGDISKVIGPFSINGLGEHCYALPPLWTR